MKANISKKNIDNFNSSYKNTSSNEIIRNALTQSNITKVAMNWDAYRKTNHVYSNVVKNEMSKVTNQKSSGRCWGFAGLNLMRIDLCRKYNLKNFEFSQNYFMFCDKLEKSNYFLENIINNLNEEFDSRLMMWLVSDPIGDGGQWDMFTNLIEKYGVLPQSAMPESFQSSQSRMMNRLITRKLREFASVLRKMNNSGSKITDLRKVKGEMMNTVYSILCMCLGTPPDKFDWQFRNKKKKFTRFTDETPQSFYKNHVDTKLKDKVCLIHCPMSNKSMNTLYTVSNLGNVVEGDIIKYANVEIDELKKAAIKSIKANEPVWFGCDVSKMFNYDLGVMDMDIYNYDLMFGTSFNVDKQTRLEYGDSLMTHAMLFTGVDIKSGHSTKWRVENSWGDKGGDKGYYLMTDKWFDEYMYEVVVDKKYLTKKILSIFDKKPEYLNPWDPMGSLAK